MRAVNSFPRFSFEIVKLLQLELWITRVPVYASDNLLHSFKDIRFTYVVLPNQNITLSQGIKLYGIGTYAPEISDFIPESLIIISSLFYAIFKLMSLFQLLKLIGKCLTLFYVTQFW